MQSSNAPNKIQLPFATSGTKNTIPVPSQQGVTPGAASFTDGFPPLTFTPLSAGGVPPAGADFNGILNAITALQQWKSAGGQFPFDATFAAAIGGYPKGATVLKADGTGLWISTTENNTANPDTGGAGWLAFSASSVQSGSYNSALDTGVTNSYAMTLSPAPVALTPGMVVTLQRASGTNTGAATLNVNGFGALPILGPGQSPLSGTEIVSQEDSTFRLSSDGSGWTIVSTQYGRLSTAIGIHAQHAVNLGQFPASLGANGYFGLPSGLIIQWGNIIVAAASIATVQLPIAFPNNFFSAVACLAGSSTYNASYPTGVAAQIVAGNKSQLIVQSMYNASSSPVSWFAIGN